MRRRWQALALLSAVLLGSWASLRVIDAWRFRTTLRAAEAEMAAARFDSARDGFSYIAARWPGRGDALLSLGLCEIGNGRIDAALEAWGRAAPGSPGAGPIAFRRGKLALEHGRLAVAEEALDRAVREGGVDQDEALSSLARVLRLEGRLADVRGVLLDGLARTAVPAELLRELWMLDAEAPPVEGIRTYLEWAGREAPGDDRIWLGRANLATRSGRFDESAEWLDRCERLRPSDAAVWRARFDLALALGDPDQVRRALGRSSVARLGPNEAWSLRGWFAAQRGDRAARAAALRELLERDPGDAETLERLAVLAAEDGDTARVAEYRGRKAELDRVRVSYKNLLARGDLGRSAELSRLAGALGRMLESRAWAVLAAEPDHESPRLRASLDRLVRDEPPGIAASKLLAELGPEAGPTPGRTPTGTETRTIPAFVDAAEIAGLRFVFDNGQTAGRQSPEMGSGGVALLDYDGDGWLDIYCVQGGPFPPPTGTAPNSDRLFRNRGDGSFEDVSESSGIAALPGGYGHGVAVGDYDNDGHPDLFVTRWRRYALYRNRGDGTFGEVTDAAGLGGDRDWPTSAAFADLDGDGDLDLYVCHYLRWDVDNPQVCRHPKTGKPAYCEPNKLPHLPDHLFRNDKGRFVDVTDQAGIVDREGRGFGVVAADLDDDGRVDLFVANDMSANYLFRNKGGLRFEEVGTASGAAANAAGGYQAGMGTHAGDLDGDGRLDLVVTNFYGESTTLFHNLGGGLFADYTASAGLAAPTRFMLGFGIAFLDANNDRHLDLMIANGHVNDFRPDVPYAMPTQVLIGDARGRLTDVTRRAGPPFAASHVGRGLAVGDLDNDGRMDAVVVAHNDPLVCLLNQTPRDGHFVTLKLEGRDSNRDAVGSRVRLVADGQRRVAQLIGGGSYQSANDARLHFGLGASRSVESIEVTWPSGRVDRYEGLAADRGYLLREGNPLPLPLKGFRP